MRYIEQNLKEFEICGILKWHEKGYTGKGIKMAEIENTIPNLPFFDGKLHDPYNICGKATPNGHGQKVFDVMHQVAPDAELYSLPSGMISNNDNVSGDFIEKTLPYTIENNIHIINASLGGLNHLVLNEKILEAQKHGVVFTTSAGNEGQKGLSGFAKSNVWIAVGAVGWNDKYREIFLKNYSSRGPELDIVCFSGLYIHDARNPDRVFSEEGTSFSSPMLAGMLALVQQFFIEKAGRTLYQDEIMKFIRDNVIDLGSKGPDSEYGYGLFVLPEPESIDVNKYLIRGESMNKPEYIIIHHSATKQGDAETFRRYHMEVNGWKDIGYHYVINNGTYKPDGLIEKGRPENEEGAHCKENQMNYKSIGICLVGNFDVDKPTQAQMGSLIKLCKDIMKRYNIPAKNVLGHHEAGAYYKTCPGKNFDMEGLRKMLEDKVIKLKIGSKEMNVNGKIVTLDVPAKIENRRTLVPLRAIAEALGCEVQYNDKTQEVTIRG